MARSEGIKSFSSVTKHNKESQNDENYASEFWGVTEKVTSAIGTGSLKRDNSYSSDVLDEYNWEDDMSIRVQPRSHPEVNMKNLLGGLVAIVGSKFKTLNGIQHQPSHSSNASFLRSESDGDSFVHPSVYVPSAPPLLVAEAINYSAYREVLEAEPPEWVPDSHASSCMKCKYPFTAITCGRHHCRFCGGIFCRGCTKGRCLLPIKFRVRDPQRVCDICYDRLDPLQGILINSISNAMQSAKHDVMDWTCTRGWLNLPVGVSMEHEIYKASNTLRSYCQVARLQPEKSIPFAILKGARGLAIMTVAKAGTLLTYKLGTGLVVSRKSDGSWSAPSAILSVGLGWGAQIGGELMDFIIVLHGSKAVKAFSSRMHCSLGAGVSAAVGPVGRVFETDLRAGDGGSGLCYTYSCSKGVFVGISLEGNIVATRTDVNLKFYGDPYLSTTDILLGNIEKPEAAAPLYSALDDLYSSIVC